MTTPRKTIVVLDDNTTWTTEGSISILKPHVEYPEGDADQLLGEDFELSISTDEALDAYLRKSCPCQHTTPCDPDCTCVRKHSSRGCTRCCSYGSPEQQREQAERLAKQEEP